MSKDRELLEEFAKHVNNKACIEDDYISVPIESFIDSFLASQPEEKDNPDYKNCTNDTVSDSGFCNLGLPCKDCRFYHNPNNQ